LSRVARAPSTLFRAPRYLERSLTVAAFITTLGIALVAVGTIVGEIVGTVLAAIGSILITVALLSVVYDAFLKDVLLGEVYAVMGIQENVQGVDLQEITLKDQIMLPEFLEDATEIKAIPLDPESWVHTDWRHLVEQASRRTVAVSVYIPNHDSPHVDVLAARLRTDRDQLSSQIAELPDRLAESWDENGESLDGSNLDVYLYSTVPTVGLLVTDKNILLEVPPAFSHSIGDRRTVAILFGRDGTLPMISDFVDGQFTTARIPGFSRSVMRPLKPFVSPDPDPLRTGSSERQEL
jgi:hypothetical protein